MITLSILILIIELIIAFGSVFLLIAKIIERKKEKKKEDWDKYSKY